MVLSGNACFRALITNSVTMRPMLTAWSEVVAPSSATTSIEIGRLSPIIELARVSQSLERYGPTGICSPFAEACRCFCTDATDRHVGGRPGDAAGFLPIRRTEPS